MDEVEMAGRVQLRRVARDLQAIRFRLQVVAWNLRSGIRSEEEGGDGEGPPTFAARASAVIESVVADCLIPARHDLRAAALFVAAEETHPLWSARKEPASLPEPRAEEAERPGKPEEPEVPE
jgi:hypothetical protein